jgi:methionyl-tRNA formyltransferase
VRLVFAGTPEPALPSLQVLIDSPRHDVVAVLTRPDAPTGRGRRLAASPVAELAASHDIPVLRPKRPSDPGFVESLAVYRPDCCPVVAYGALLRPELLAVPRLGWINLHFSVLPAWRGAAPVQAAVRYGDEVTGASVFQLEEGLDTGPVFGVVTESIGPLDTSGDLLGRLARSGAELLLAILDGIEDGTLRPVPQPAEGVSHAPKVTVADTEVDWRAPSSVVDRLIRSATPEPGAWTTFRGARLGLGPVQPIQQEGLAPGELRVEKRRVLAGTATGAVQLGTVVAEGKRAMAAEDWARGTRPEPGERFDSVDAGLAKASAGEGGT